MARIKVPSLKSLRALAHNPQLGDPAAPGAPVALTLSEDFAEDIREGDACTGNVRVGAGLSASLLVVNDVNDPNPDGLFDFTGNCAPEEPPASAVGELELSAPIRFDPSLAYLVLNGISATGKLSASADGSGLGVGLDGSAGLSLATCTAFPRGTRLLNAAEEACDHFKTAFSVADLAALRPNETLVLGIQGSLKLSLQVSTASIADALGVGLRSVCSGDFPLAVSTAPGASLEIGFEVCDGFRLFVQSGAAEGERVFSVRKAGSRLVSADASVGIKATFPQTALLLDLVARSFAQLTGLPGELIDRVVAAGDAHCSFSPDEEQKIERAVSLLKLRDPALPSWKKLRQALKAAEDRVRAVLPRQVEARLGYTWRRLTADSHVARFRIQAGALARNHADILRLNFAALIRASRESDSGVVFDRFLGRRSDKVELGWGFSFGLNDFTLLKSADRRSTEFIFLQDIDQRVQVSFLGKRGYSSTWLDASRGHLVELNAAMPRFTPAPPRAGDFEVGLQVCFTWERQPAAALLADLLDHAVVVGALPGAELVEDGAFRTAVAGRAGGDVDAVVSIVVPPAVMPALLDQLAGPDGVLLLAYALARALPAGSLGEEFIVRREVEPRMKAYAPVWNSFLANEEVSLDQLGLLASQRFALDLPRLARLESDPERQWGWSVRGVARNFGGTEALREACDKLRFALQQLARRNAPGVSYQVFQSVLRDASGLWADHYGARVFGALLFLAASRCPGALAHIPRKISVSWKDPLAENSLSHCSGDAE